MPKYPLRPIWRFAAATGNRGPKSEVSALYDQLLAEEKEVSALWMFCCSLCLYCSAICSRIIQRIWYMPPWRGNICSLCGLFLIHLFLIFCKRAHSPLHAILRNTSLFINIKRLWLKSYPYTFSLSASKRAFQNYSKAFSADLAIFKEKMKEWKAKMIAEGNEHVLKRRRQGYQKLTPSSKDTWNEVCLNFERIWKPHCSC